VLYDPIHYRYYVDGTWVAASEIHSSYKGEIRRMPGAPEYTPPECPIIGQDGPTGFKARLAEYIRRLPPEVQVEYVREWLPGPERFTVDWREQQRRIAAGEPYELCITLRPHGPNVAVPAHASRLPDAR
jgi:hypothetical protein